MPSFAAIFAHLMFGLSWIGWIVMLGGVAGMQAKCGGFPIEVTKLKEKAQDYFVVEEGCSSASTTSLIWWSTWFEFFVLILLSVAQCFRRQGLVVTKQIFLAMVTVIMMVGANVAHQTISTWDGALAHSAAANLAGTVLCMICNMVMMLYFGGEVASMLPEKPSSASEKQPIRYDLTAELATSGPSFSSMGPQFNTV